MADNVDPTAVAGESASAGGVAVDDSASPTALKTNSEPTASPAQLGDSEQPEFASEISQPDDTASHETPFTPIADTEISESICPAAVEDHAPEVLRTENLRTTEQLEQPTVHPDTTEVSPATVISEVDPTTLTSEVLPATVPSEVPPITLTSEVPSVTVTSEVPSANVTSEVPPVTVTSEIPSPTVTSEVPPKPVISEVPPAVVPSEVPPSEVPKLSRPMLDIVPADPEPTSNQTEFKSTLPQTEDEEMALDDTVTENTEANPNEHTNDTSKPILSEGSQTNSKATEISLSEEIASRLPHTKTILTESSQDEVEHVESSQIKTIPDESAPPEIIPTDLIPSEAMMTEPITSELLLTEPISSEESFVEPISAVQTSVVSLTVKSELIDEQAESEDVEMAEPLSVTEPKSETLDLETEVEPRLDTDEPMETQGPTKHVTTDQVDFVAEIEKEACAASTGKEADDGEEDGERTVTMLDVLQEQEALEDSAGAVLGGSDDNNCTYTEGYIKRQALYACMTCCSEAKEDPAKRAGVCLACSLTCHENHELIELYTKRNFRCDCGNPNFNSQLCNFTKEKNDLNVDNKYNQNFSGLYCICHRPYPDPESTVDDEMIQCIMCEDWLHASHLDATVPANDQYSEMICKLCMDKNEFLHDYTSYAVAVEQNEADAVSLVDNINGIENEPPKKTAEVKQTLNSDSTQIEGQDSAALDSASDMNRKLINDLSENNLKVCTDEVNLEKLQDPHIEVTFNEPAVKDADKSEVTSDVLAECCDNKIGEENKVSDTNITEKTEEKDIHMEQKNVEEPTGDPHKTELAIDNEVNMSEVCTESSQQEENSLKEKPSIDTASLDNNSLINVQENEAPKETLQESNKICSEGLQEVESINETDVTTLPVISTLDNLKNDISEETSIHEDGAQGDKSCDISEQKNLPSETVEDNSTLTKVSATNNELKLTDISSDDKTDNVGKEADSDVDTNICENTDGAQGDKSCDISEQKNLINETVEGNCTLTEVSATNDESKLREISSDEKTENVAKEAGSDVDTNIGENTDSVLPVTQSQDDIKNSEDSLVANIELSNISKTDIEMNKDETSVANAAESKTDFDMNTTETKDLTTTEKPAEEVEAAADVEMKNDSASINCDGNSLNEADKRPSDNIVEGNDNTDIQATAANETNDKVNNEIKLNGDVHQEDIDFEATSKRKFSTDITDDVEQLSVKKVKLNGDANNCQRPKPKTKKIFKGATFWPCSWRQKLCSCHNCVSMYRDHSVLFLLDLEDTVSAYEELGKAKNGGKLSQYEKGLEALSSLDRIQQINALTEYNKMKDDLLDFLISFKNRQEVVKVEDIEKFFADIKPKRKSDGVYFCR